MSATPSRRNCPAPDRHGQARDAQVENLGSSPARVSVASPPRRTVRCNMSQKPDQRVSTVLGGFARGGIASQMGRFETRWLTAQKNLSALADLRLQSRQLSAHAGNARADQRLVAHQPQGEADQDRRQAGQPRPLRRLPDGRGRRAKDAVRRDPATDRGTAAAA